MGRAKQSMKLITDGRNRNLTFRKRKEGLKKKAHELQVLCDVEVCIIIYGSDGPTVRELEIWPSNPASVQLLIDSYNNQPIEDRNRRTETLSNFFDKKRQNVENDLLKLRKKNEMVKYTTWDTRYDNLSFEHLREFGGLLEAKIGVVKNRIETIKGAQNCSLSSNIVGGFMLPQHQPIASSFNPSEINFPVNYYPFQHTQQFLPNYPMNNFPYVGGCFDDTTLGNFSTPCVGYFGNGNTESQMMAPYMQFTKMESSSVWYEQMMKNQSRDQV